MKKMDKLLSSAMAAFVAITATSATVAASEETEKCYGIVKTGMNDCATAKASCAGSATKDKQGDAFIFMPKGMCDKIVGGSLKAK